MIFLYIFPSSNYVDDKMMTWDDYFFLSFQRTCPMAKLWLIPRVGDEIISVDEFLVYNSDLPIFQDAFQTGEPTANFASQIHTLMANHPNFGMLGTY